jgi:hypothetical protein
MVGLIFERHINVVLIPYFYLDAISAGDDRPTPYTTLNAKICHSR